jgi:hypothetical protein
VLTLTVRGSNVVETCTDPPAGIGGVSTSPSSVVPSRTNSVVVPIVTWAPPWFVIVAVTVVFTVSRTFEGFPALRLTTRLNSAVATETEMRIPSRSMSYV